jgi:hypothetical protein
VQCSNVYCYNFESFDKAWLVWLRCKFWLRKVKNIVFTSGDRKITSARGEGHKWFLEAPQVYVKLFQAFLRQYNLFRHYVYVSVISDF